MKKGCVKLIVVHKRSRKSLLEALRSASSLVLSIRVVVMWSGPHQHQLQPPGLDRADRSRDQSIMRGRKGHGCQFIILYCRYYRIRTTLGQYMPVCNLEVPLGCTGVHVSGVPTHYHTAHTQRVESEQQAFPRMEVHLPSRAFLAVPCCDCYDKHVTYTL